MTEDTTPERDSAIALQSRHQEKVAAIENNRDLSSDGRQRQLAELYHQTRTRLDELKVRDKQKLQARQDALEQRLFGLNRSGVQDPASHAISARDAQDRAARLTKPDEAAGLLRRSESGRDDILARAIVQHAIEQARTAVMPSDASRWDEVTREYLDARPHLTGVVEELAEIERLTAPSILGPFSLSQPYGVLPRHMNAASAHQLADRPTGVPVVA